MLVKKIFWSGILFLFTIFTTSRVLAVTSSIETGSSNITNGEIEIVVTISGAGAGTNYIKGEFFKEESTNYFGETYNGVDWYSGSSYTSYLPISIQSGQNAVVNLKVRIGTPTASQYDGPGQYKLRIRRYTASGSYNSSEANESAILVSFLPSVTPSLAALISPTLSPDISQAPTAVASNPTAGISASILSPTLVSSSIKYSNIYLSEVMVSPNTSENEWVEIYNGNNFAINLSDWSIDDVEAGGSLPKTITLEIAPYGYGVITFASSIFNNDGDSVRLLNAQKEVVDSFSYKEGIKGKSVGRTSFGEINWCDQEPSPGAINKGCLLELQKAPSSTPAPTLSLFQTFDTDNIDFSDSVESDQFTNLSLSSPVNLDTQNFDLSKSTYQNKPILNGQVLGANESEYDENDSRVAYVKGLTTSSFSLSLFNIFYIIHKVFKKAKNETN